MVKNFFSTHSDSEKMILEYRRAMDRAEAEVSKLQANLNRLDGILEKFRTKVERAEEHEKVLQDEKRQALREVSFKTCRLVSIMLQKKNSTNSLQSI